MIWRYDVFRQSTITQGLLGGGDRKDNYRVKALAGEYTTTTAGDREDNYRGEALAGRLRGIGRTTTGVQEKKNKRSRSRIKGS